MEPRRTYLKVLIILVLILIFLIPIALIRSLIRERMNYQQEAMYDISSKWGNEQTLAGPVLTIPYIDFYTDTSRIQRRVVRYAHFLPDSLFVNGELFPERRYRSIYEIVVYNSHITLEGTFSQINLEDIKALRENILLNEAFLSIGISDLRGIEEQADLQWDNHTLSFNSGVASTDVIETGISTRLPLLEDSLGGLKRFKLNLVLKGSQALNVVPVGRITMVNVRSAWQNPSFGGAFLPDNRTVDANGFSSTWKVLHLNRNYPQAWTGAGYNIFESAFGVNLLLPVDNYQKTERAVKYSYLLITLTFLLLFFVEILHGISIHPFQYLLVGFGLTIFFTLLLSVSEHVGFDAAYAISGVATIVLITLYIKQIVPARPVYLLMMGMLIILDGFIFTLLQLQDYALLMGNIGLFVILAVVMYYSRKIDWYNLKLL